jgi:hypothetical protein
LVGDSVRASVGDLVGDSVGASVGDSVWDSVGASVWAYVSSFFNIQFEYNYSSLIKLWELGLIPSFDKKIWRIHGKPNAKILWKGKLS